MKRGLEEQLKEKDLLINHYKQLVKHLAGPRDLGHCKGCSHYFQYSNMNGCDMGCESRCDDCFDGDTCSICDRSGCSDCIWICNEVDCRYVLCDHCRDLGHSEKHKCPKENN